MHTNAAQYPTLQHDRRAGRTSLDYASRSKVPGGSVGGLLKRRDEVAEKETGRIVALKRDALAAENKLTRLYEAIEAGLADLTDSNLKRCIFRVEEDQGRRPGRCRTGRGPNEGANRNHARGATHIRHGAKDRMRHSDGSFRRNYIRQLVQRAEVGTEEIPIAGSRSRLLKTLVASGEKPAVDTAARGVRSFDL